MNSAELFFSFAKIISSKIKFKEKGKLL